MSRVEPPSFLEDLLGEVLGETLGTWSTTQHGCSVRVGVEQPRIQPHQGLFFDAKREYGVHHHGMTWEVYSGGRPRFGHAWDDNEPDNFGEPVAFEDWLRGEVVALKTRIASKQRPGTD